MYVLDFSQWLIAIVIFSEQFCQNCFDYEMICKKKSNQNNIKTESHHDVKVDVFAGLFSRKEGQVLRLHLIRVIQHRPRIVTFLRNRDIVLDP